MIWAILGTIFGALGLFVGSAGCLIGIGGIFVTVHYYEKIEKQLLEKLYNVDLCSPDCFNEIQRYVSALVSVNPCISFEFKDKSKDGKLSKHDFISAMANACANIERKEK